MIKQSKHYKSEKEDSLSKIYIDLTLLLLYFVVLIIVCIDRKADIIQELPELISINPFSALVAFTLLHIIFLIIHSVIYKRKKKIIMAKGNIIEGRIIDTLYIKSKLIKSPASSYIYKYHVRLSDGREVDTEIYYEDFVKNNSITACSVYEYNAHYYFTDFR